MHPSRDFRSQCSHFFLDSTRGLADNKGTVPLILVIASGPQKGRVFELDGSRTIELGRHCHDLPIEDSRMSKRHAALVPDGDHWVIADLDSSNGTFVNGEPVLGRRTLDDGDRVQLGRTYFVVTRRPQSLDGVAAERPAPPAGDIAASDFARLHEEALASSHEPLLAQSQAPPSDPPANNQVVQVVRREQRPATGENVVAVIRLSDLTPALRQELLLTGAPARPARRWPWALVALLLLGALGVNTYLLLNDRQRGEQMRQEILAQLAQARSKEDLQASLETLQTRSDEKQRRMLDEVLTQVRQSSAQTEQRELLQSVLTEVKESREPVESEEEKAARLEREAAVAAKLDAVLRELEAQRASLQALKDKPVEGPLEPGRSTQTLPATAPQPTPAALDTDSDESVAFLVDVSGSMIDVLPLAVEELGRQLRSLKATQRFTVILFQAGTAVEWEPGGLRPADAEQQSAAVAWLRGEGRLIPRGSSNPLAALQRAMDLKPQRIRILSERLTGSRGDEVTPDTLLAAVAELDSGRTTRIDTIQFFDFDEQATLRRLAEATGGRHVQLGFRPAPVTSPNDDDLGNVLQ